MTRKTVLVTAFEPFGGESLNPSEKVLCSLPDAAYGLSVRKLLLPVEFRRSLALAAAAFEAIRPDALVMLGQAGGRSAVTPETTARNEMNARIPDNAGFRPEHLPVVEGGPETCRSTLPLEAILRETACRGIPCELSGDAGTYVCNALFYGMLHRLQGAVPAGFIHLPYIREQGREPFLELETLLQAADAVLHCLAPAV